MMHLLHGSSLVTASKVIQHTDCSDLATPTMDVSNRTCKNADKYEHLGLELAETLCKIA